MQSASQKLTVKALFYEVGEGQRPICGQAETRLFPQKTRRPFDSIPCYKATGTERLVVLLACCIISLQVLCNLSGWKIFQVQLKYLEIKLRSMFTLLSFRSKYYSLGLTLKISSSKNFHWWKACFLKMLSAITVTDVTSNPQVTHGNLSKCCQMSFGINSIGLAQLSLIACPW